MIPPFFFVLQFKNAYYTYNCNKHKVSNFNFSWIINYFDKCITYNLKEILFKC